MKLASYESLLAQPLAGRARALLVVATIAIPFAFLFPLWTMAFRSNQCPDPLRLAIHINRLEGQLTPTRDDIREINSLYHYMMPPPASPNGNVRPRKKSSAPPIFSGSRTAKRR